MDEQDKESLHSKWTDRSESEKRSRSRFAQHSIKPEEVSAELAAVREAIGAGPAVRSFVLDVLKKSGLHLSALPNDQYRVEFDPNTPRSVKQALDREDTFARSDSTSPSAPAQTTFQGPTP